MPEMLKDTVAARFTVKIGIFFCLLTTMVWAQPPVRSFLKMYQNGMMQSENLPKADAKGDYSRREIGNHAFWMVVANDGLNGRWNPNEAEIADKDIANWPVVRIFAAGSLLTAVESFETQTGFFCREDRSNKMWLRVLDGQTDKPRGYCFVRCNKNFIVPVRISRK